MNKKIMEQHHESAKIKTETKNRIRTVNNSTHQTGMKMLKNGGEIITPWTNKI